MVGSATLTIVRSTIVMKNETASTAKARHLWMVVIGVLCQAGGSESLA